MCSSPATAMQRNQTTMTGPKNAATRAVPRRCTANSPIRIAMVIGTTKCSEAGIGELQPLNGRQHRDRRRDDRVAEEHRGADHAEHQHERRAPADRPEGERGERERAALAVVVGAQQDEHVFDRHDDDQRPQDHRKDAEHDLARDRAGGTRPRRPPRGTRRAGSCRCRRRRRRCSPSVSAAETRGSMGGCSAAVGRHGGLAGRFVHGADGEPHAALRNGRRYSTRHQTRIWG